jgi:hypothetical protein
MELGEIIHLYLKYLKSADIDKLLKLFAKDAIVHSPVYGEMDATAFYTKLFEDTEKSTIKVINIYEISNVLSAAAYFNYKWKKKDGSTTTFDCVDIFNFDKFMKIEELRIIYNK